METKIESKQLRPREFQKSSSQILNRGKVSASTIINDPKNDPKFISSQSDKAQRFATIFASNSTLDNNGHPILTLTLHNPSNIFNFTQKVSSFIKSFDTRKATGSDKFLAVVPKNINPELSSIIAKVLNRYLKKEKSFSSL